MANRGLRHSVAPLMHCARSSRPAQEKTTFSQSLLKSVRHDQSKWIGKPSANVCPTLGKDFKFFSSDQILCRPQINASVDPFTGQVTPIYGAQVPVSGFRLQDSRASYGIGLETFALGFPIHFDWSWRTLFNQNWEDVVFASEGGSSAFRKPKFSVWIGYDF